MALPTSLPPDRRQPPAVNVPPATLTLAGLLTAAFVTLHIAGPGLQETAVVWLSLIPLRVAAALDGPFGLETLAALATLFTHAVVHLDLLHFLVNAGFLLAFGSAAERGLGTGRYLLLVAGSALGGAVAQLVVDWHDQVVMFGASGVVSGCMGGVTRLMLSGRSPPGVRRTALNLIGAFMAINILFALVGGGLMGVEAEVAWEAHLGGFLAGYVLAGGSRRRDDAP